MTNLDCIKFIKYGDNKFNTSIDGFLLSGRVENIVGKGKYAGKHFVLFPQWLQKSSCPGL